MLPDENGGVTYFALPVSWGLKPIKVMMDSGFDALAGQSQGVTDTIDKIGAAAINAYNPVGGTDIVSGLTPTILDAGVEISRNKGWHGGKIRPDWDQNAPADIQYFNSLEETVTGQSAIKVSKGLLGIGMEVSPANLKYGFEQLIGGAGRTAGEAINLLVGGATGDIPPIDETPFAGRFIKIRDEDEIGSGTTDADAVKDLLSGQSRERFVLRQQAEDSHSQLSQLPSDEANKRFQQLAKEDKELASEVSKIVAEDKLGLTYTERLIGQLGVQNGERAKYLVSKFNELETDEDKENLWKEYVQKKLISKEVRQQMAFLLSQ